MKINDISIQSEGYIYCKSAFYTAHDSLSKRSLYTFSQGINKLIGEIDSGNWAISYLISMYRHRQEDFVLFEELEATINNEAISITELSDLSCYMDMLDPLFSPDYSVRELVAKGLEYSKLNYTPDGIKDLFYLDAERFDRPLTGVGNEIFRAMSAIGFSYKKEIFCFPWLSRKRFDGYHENLTTLLQILEKLGKVVILPLGTTV